ncbi:unnamed protein product [Peronospora belbahrii]|uniref:Nudix hydrolase domain-containing protein n=1 Tax=Peronospora belbahrii TaxID=622444 RepID=A0ABN8CV23_9STRA|nr:unnamed protein product [Peronospora belbahrii]
MHLLFVVLLTEFARSCCGKDTEKASFVTSISDVAHDSRALLADNRQEKRYLRPYSFDKLDSAEERTEPKGVMTEALEDLSKVDAFLSKTSNEDSSLVKAAVSKIEQGAFKEQQIKLAIKAPEKTRQHERQESYEKLLNEMKPLKRGTVKHTEFLETHLPEYKDLNLLDDSIHQLLWVKVEKDLREKNNEVYVKGDGHSLHIPVADFEGIKRSSLLGSHSNRAAEAKTEKGQKVAVMALVSKLDDKSKLKKYCITSSSYPDKSNYVAMKGGVVEGESLPSAVVREVDEEAGYVVALSDEKLDIVTNEKTETHVFEARVKETLHDYPENSRFRLEVELIDAIKLVGGPRTVSGNMLLKVLKKQRSPEEIKEVEDMLKEMDNIFEIYLKKKKKKLPN